MLAVENLDKSYPTGGGSLFILRNVSLRLARGESAAIMGPSGAGKSTLLNILGTLEAPTSGRVTFDGRNPFALNERELASFRNRHIGFVFQEHHLLPQCSVLENVLLPTLAIEENARGSARAGLADAATKRATSLLERVGLGQRMDHRPSELSGGERQRVALARAMIKRPLLVLADEPTGNLDRRTADVVATLLHELHREDQTVLVVVTHSELLAQRFGRRLELTDGALSEH